MVGVAFLLAIATGANDETFAAVVSSKKLTINQAVIVGAGLAVIGSLIFGRNVSKTIGKDISTLDLSQETIMVFAILFAMALSLIIASYFGIPISSTHAMVGAVTVLSIWIGGMKSVNWPVVGKVFLSWFISPLLGFVGSYYIMKLVHGVMKKRVKGLNDLERNYLMYSNFLLISVTITAISRAGNDVSNAVAPIFPAFDQEGFPLIPFLIGGIGLGIGLILLGRRVLKTLGSDIVDLTPEKAFAVQVATAFVTFTAASLGIPVSGTQILVASFVGVGVASNSQVNWDVIKKIVFSAFLTPVISGIFGILFYLGISSMGVV